MSNVPETPCEFNAIEYANYTGPNPTRTWTRSELLCNNNTYTTAQLNENKKKQLSYINNSANLTKPQKYSGIVRGVGPNGNKVWATQGMTYTDPNVFNLPQNGNTLSCRDIPVVGGGGVTAISDEAGGTQITGVVNIVPRGSGIGTSIGGTSGQDIQIENLGVIGIIPNANGLPQPQAIIGSVGLIAGSNISLSATGQNITITATGGGAGIETINSVTPISGDLLLSSGSGISVLQGYSSNEIIISNVGVGQIQLLDAGGGITGIYSGQVSFKPGTNITMSDNGEDGITINAIGDGAGIETINGLTPTAGAFLINAGSGINIVFPAPNAIEIDNAGVLSVATTGNPPATGAISLVAGTNVTITEAGGAFTINSSGGGGGGGVTAISNGNGGAQLTDVVNIVGKTGIETSIVEVGQTINISNSGVLSVAGGGNTYTGAVSVLGGSGITITNPHPQEFLISNTGAGSTFSYTNNVEYEMINVDRAFQPIDNKIFNLSNVDDAGFVVSIYNPTAYNFTPIKAEAVISDALTGLLCGNSTQNFLINQQAFNSTAPYNATMKVFEFPSATPKSTYQFGFGTPAYTTIYAITADDNYFYTVVNNSLDGRVTVMQWGKTDGEPVGIIDIFSYQLAVGIISVNQVGFTAQVISGTTYLSLGAGFGYYTVVGGENVTNQIAAVIEVTALGMIFIYNNQDTTYTNLWMNCLLLNANQVVLGYEVNDTQQLTLKRQTITGDILQTTNVLGFNNSRMTLKTVTPYHIIALQKVGTTYTYCRYNNLNLSQAGTVSGIPQHEYNFFGEYVDVYNAGNIHFNSSIFHNNYLYQQSLDGSVTVAGDITPDSTVNLTFQVPCGDTVMPNLWFPINVRTPSTVTGNATMRGQFISASAGLAKIGIVVTNTGASSILAGNLLYFTLSPFTLMPTS